MVQRHIVKQYFTTLAASLGGFCLGCSLAFSSPSGPILTNGTDANIHLTDEEYGHFSSIMNLGSVIGCFCCAPLMCYFGMRWAMIFSVLTYITGWCIIIFSRSFEMLLGARILTGFGSGISQIASPTFIAEISSVDIRGKLCASFELMVSLGVLLNYILPLITDSFRYMAGANLVVPILHLVLLLICKESPVFLVSREKEKEAKRSLEHYGGRRELEERFDDLRNFIEGRKKEKKTLKTFWTDPVCRKPLLIMTLLVFLFNFSGITSVVFNLNQIFQSVKSNISEEVSPIIVGVIQASFNVFAAYNVDRWGRRILLINSTLFMGFSIVCLGAYFYVKDSFPQDSYIGWLPLISVCVYFASFAFGLGPVPWIILGEIFPPDIKDKATSISIALHFVSAYTATALYIPLTGVIGLSGVFWMHGGFCFVSIAYACFILVETKGKTPQEIAQLF